MPRASLANQRTREDMAQDKMCRSTGFAHQRHAGGLLMVTLSAADLHEAWCEVARTLGTNRASSLRPQFA